MQIRTTARRGDDGRTTRSANRRWLLGPTLMLVLLIAIGGCGSPATGISTSSAPSVTERASPASIGGFRQSTSADGTQQFTIDAGVVFVDEATYRCIPLSELGVESVDQIKSIETSCECLQPSTVGYHESSNAVDHALRLDFLAQHKRRDPMNQGRLLGATPVWLGCNNHH